MKEQKMEKISKKTPKKTRFTYIVCGPLSKKTYANTEYRLNLQEWS